jgi:sigma-B regulation protein RsbU (phosphoserine phosphatase)
MALGVDDACRFSSGSRPGLAEEDVLLIGTDGIWEARNSFAENFGKERIGQILRDHHRQSAESIQQKILDALEEFRGTRQLEDDVTLLIIKACAPKG